MHKLLVLVVSGCDAATASDFLSGYGFAHALFASCIRLERKARARQSPCLQRLSWLLIHYYEEEFLRQGHVTTFYVHIGYVYHPK
jgi:hypothetical protein